MKAPFKLPIQHEDGGFLTAEDQELICGTEAATDAELDYIVLSVNHHEQLVTLTKELADYAENATLEGDALPSCVIEAQTLLATLK